MSTTFTSYPEIPDVAPENAPVDDRFRKMAKLLQKERKKRKRWKRESRLHKEQVETMRVAEEKRIAEERAAEESRKEDSFLKKLGDAIVKHAAKIITCVATAVIGFFLKRKSEPKLDETDRMLKTLKLMKELKAVA